MGQHRPRGVTTTAGGGGEKKAIFHRLFDKSRLIVMTSTGGFGRRAHKADDRTQLRQGALSTKAGKLAEYEYSALRPSGDVWSRQSGCQLSFIIRPGIKGVQVHREPTAAIQFSVKMKGRRPSADERDAQSKAGLSERLPNAIQHLSKC